MLSLPSTTDVLVNGKEEQEKTWNPLVHWHEESPGGLSLGSQGSLEPAVCIGVFILLAAAHMTSTQFLSCCHQSLRLTREALGQHRQNQLYAVLPSGKLMRGCRNCCIKYLVWTSVSFTALSLSAGGSTSSASDHSCQDWHEAEHRAGSAACSGQKSNTWALSEGGFF